MMHWVSEKLAGIRCFHDFSLLHNCHTVTDTTDYRSAATSATLILDTVMHKLKAQARSTD